MATKIVLKGVENLSPYIKEENLVLAASKVGSYFGLKRIKLVISNKVREEEAEYEGEPNPLVHGFWDGTRNHIILYNKAMREWCKRKVGRSIRKAYATTLVHEIVHMSQERRGGMEVLPDKLCEKEASYMERVYGPVALECLRAGA